MQYADSRLNPRWQKTGAGFSRSIVANERRLFWRHRKNQWRDCVTVFARAFPTGNRAAIKAIAQEGDVSKAVLIYYIRQKGKRF